MSVNILGVGPGNIDYVLPIVSKKIKISKIIIGDKRVLDIFDLKEKKVFDYKKDLNTVIDLIKKYYENNEIAILVSGDTGIFSLANYIDSKLSNIELNFFPGLSSSIYFLNKLKVIWDDVKFISFHGRKNNLYDILIKNDKVLIFSDKDTLKCVSKKLMDYGFNDVDIVIGENLSYENEKITRGKPIKFIDKEMNNLYLIYIEKNFNLKNKLYRFGIPDYEFVRGNVPMTKEEIRVLSISKLRLLSNMIVLDIGAGTGSVSIECALSDSSLKICAIEKNQDAVSLIKENRKKFCCYNLKIIHGKAPKDIKDEIIPDRVFIGGTSGNLKNIIKYIVKLQKRIRVVANTITIESLNEIVSLLKEYNFENIDIVNIMVSKNKKIKDKNMMIALNPVYIISCDSKISNNNI